VLRIVDRVPALRQLAQAGLSIVGADAHATRSLPELRWPPRTVLVLGSEAPELAREVCASWDAAHWSRSTFRSRLA